MLDKQVELINWRWPKTLLLPGPVPGQEKGKLRLASCKVAQVEQVARQTQILG